MGLLECERGADDGSELSLFGSGDSEECRKANRSKKITNDKVTRNNKSKTDQLSLGRADLFEHLLARSRSYIFSEHHTSATIGVSRQTPHTLKQWIVHIISGALAGWVRVRVFEVCWRPRMVLSRTYECVLRSRRRRRRRWNRTRAKPETAMDTDNARCRCDGAREDNPQNHPGGSRGEEVFELGVC